MTDLVVLPVVLPALAGLFIVLAARFDPALQRRLSLAAGLANAALAVTLLAMAWDGPPIVVLLGNWPAPYGIVLVADRLSCLFLVMTALVATAGQLAAMDGDDGRGRHFHALLQLQVMGINGALLTGDLFNLFVFFEVLLIASFGLALHGGGKARLQAGLVYVVVNLVGSLFFLVGVGLIYAMAGTLNLADLARRLLQLEPGAMGLVQVGGALVVVVFALKAALAPLHGWLPATYGVAVPAVAAVFAVLSKVGVYALLRVLTLAQAGGAAMPSAWLLGAALLTQVLAVAGMLAARDLGQMAAHALLLSTGTLVVAVAGLDQPGVTAAVYYTLHSAVVGAAMFLLAGAVTAARGAAQDRLEPALPAAGARRLSILFFLVAIGTSGLPPLSGFLGKLGVLQASGPGSGPAWGLTWAVLLGTSLLAVLALARAGSVLFWKVLPAGANPPPTPPPTPPPPSLTEAAVILLVMASVLLAGLAAPVLNLSARIARDLLAPQAYLDAVLGASTAELPP